MSMNREIIAALGEVAAPGMGAGLSGGGKGTPAKDKQRLEELAQAFGGKLVKGALHATIRGVEMRLRIGSPKAGFCLISVVTEEVGRLRATRRCAVDRWLGPLVPSEPVHGNDRAFDEAVLIETRDMPLARALLADRAVRTELKGFVALCGSYVQLKGERLVLCCKRAELGKTLDTEILAGFVERLGRVARTAVAVARRHQFTPAPTIDKPAIAVVGGALVLLLVAVISMATAIAEYPLIDATSLLPLGAALGLPLALVTMVGAAWIVSARSAPQRLMLLVILLLGVGVPVLSHGLLHLANGAFDTSNPQMQQLPIVEIAHYTEDDNGATRHKYRVAVDGAPPLQGRTWYPVASADWVRIETGASELMVGTREGRIGAAWLWGFSLVGDSLSPEPLRGDGRR